MKALEHIRSKQEEWLEKIKPFLLQNNVNVGSGFGFFSRAAQQGGFAMTSLEVVAHPKAVNKDDLVLYDGNRMPFADGEFDTATAMYVLHHTTNPLVTLGEMKRVARRRVILVEELYSGFFSKICLVVVDVFLNYVLFGQHSDIHLGSYFSRKKFSEAVQAGGWKIIHYQSNSRFGFDTVLCVVERK